MAPNQDEVFYRHARTLMVERQIKARGVKDPRVLKAMETIPRHLFVPPAVREHAYEDSPLPIGHDQTISQPYIVAYMTEQLRLTGTERVLEIGTGSGYQAAVLAELAREVYTIEIVAPLAQEAEERLRALGYHNIFFRIGDGYRGWPEAAPFDAIIVTAAPPDVPEALVSQLKEGGCMVVPVGVWHQRLLRIIRKKEGYTVEELLPVRFVPMVQPRE